MSVQETTDVPVVDVNVPRFNQAVVALLTAAAFVAQAPWLVAVAFGLLMIGRLAGPDRAPVSRFYARVVRPRVDPGGPTKFEDARPPAFSQALGTAFTGSALVAFAVGWSLVGWILTLAVAALATLAAAARICVGCILYERFLAR